MPDLNVFYAFKMTTYGGGKSDNSNNSNSGSNGCCIALVVLTVIG